MSEIQWCWLHVASLGALYPGGPVRHTKTVHVRDSRSRDHSSDARLGAAWPDGHAGCRSGAAARPTAPRLQRVNPADQRSAALQKAYAAIPLAFVENRRQTDPRVKYYAVGDHYAFFATRDELMLSLTKDKQAQELALALRFRNHSPDVTVTGTNRMPGTVNYLGGKTPARSQTGLSRYGQIAYHDLWPNIDLLLRESAGVLKYEFHVRPGGRVSDIRLAYAGAKGLALGAAGAAADPDGGRSAPGRRAGVLPDDHRPTGAGEQPLRARAAEARARRHGSPSTSVPTNETTSWSSIPASSSPTFLGGNSAETGAGIAVDGSGNVLHRRHDPVAQLPDHDRGVQAHRRGQQLR